MKILKRVIVLPYCDIREFVDRLEAEGELKRIKTEVDWNLEIGAITRRDMDLRGPALLFENISGYSVGKARACMGNRVLGNILSVTKPVVQGRMALAMDIPKDTQTMRIIDEFGERIKRPIKPEIVKTGPCKENIHASDDINLLEFPVPLIHSADGGRFIGTWHIDVTRDPDTGWVNWGMYRHMVHDKNTMGIQAGQYQHAMLHFQKYEEKGQDMPIAVAIGTEPVSSIVAAVDFPAYVNEADMAGAIRREPVKLVKCETVDLYVPAASEIVIEGFVKLQERRLEGPFGEWTGYRAGKAAPRHVIHVTCITHRDDPILTMSNPGKPWDDYGIISSVAMSSMLSTELKNRGIPFKSVYVPPPVMGAIVSARPIYAGFTHTLASAIWSSKPGLLLSNLFVVGEDVDVTSMEDVFWCLTSRMHPINGIHIQRGTPAVDLFPFLTRDEKKEKCTCGRVLFDATFPADWPKEEVPLIIDFEHAWPEEVREKVLAKWKSFEL